MLAEGKVALVTGAASGLGRACAQALVEAGASVVVVDLPSSEGEATADKLGPSARFAPADVTDPREVQAAVDLASSTFGGLHIAVSCAGIGTAGRTVSREGPLALEDFARVVAVNLVGTFNVVRLAAARMAEGDVVDDERGVLVNTASTAAFDGQVGQVAYASSKGGVAAMTLPVARDLAGLRIRCVAVAPGTFDTPMLGGLPQPQRDALAQATPHPQRLGRPGEFGALVRHVVENPMLNGEVIRLDGALRMSAR